MIDNICVIRHILAISLIPCMVVCMVIMFKFRKTKNKKPVFKSIFVLFSIGLVVLLLNTIIEHKIRQEIITNLSETKVQEILLNDKLPDINSELLKDAFLKVGKVSSKRGSGRIKKYNVRIVNDDSDYSFMLYQNTYEPSKYHVKTDRYKYELEVGMITTNLLNELD